MSNQTVIASLLRQIRDELHIANRLELARQQVENFERQRAEGAYDEQETEEEDEEVRKMIRLEQQEMAENTELILKWSHTVKLLK